MDVVLNWFTQGVIVAILAATALRVIPRSRAQARYGVLWTAFLLVLTLPTVPAVLAIVVNGPTVDLVPTAASTVVTMPTTWWTSPAAAVGLWIVWACIQAVRLGVSALRVRNTRRRGRSCAASVLARLPHWSRVSVPGRRTRVILSNDVRAAAVLGSGAPVIALAPTLIGQLSVADLDRVLIHEWAHVQRRDDLAQLAQRILRIVVGWHPATWWLEQQLDFEREAACDEIAVSVTGSAKGYATCLATLAALPDARLRSVAVLAAASPCRLRRRIERILAAPRLAAAHPWRAITVGGGAGLLACTLVVGNMQFVTSAVTSAVASTAAYPLRPQPVVANLAVALESVGRTEPGPSPVAAGRRGSRERPRPAPHAASPRVDKTKAIGEPSPSATAFEPSQASVWLLDPASSIPVATYAFEPAVPASVDTSAPVFTVSTEPRPAAETRAAWTRAADVGIDIGRVSQTAGTATAGFFRRFGQKLAGAF